MLSSIVILYSKLRRRLKMLALRPAFKRSGDNFKFDPYGFYTYNNITVGNDVFIAQGAHFSATLSSISVGHKVMIGPNVTAITGDHNTSVIGAYMKDIENKEDHHDQPIVINDDVWIGACVTILKGVTLGEGSIVAAGSLVRTDVSPYTIVAGVPAKKIRDRFTAEELTEHLDKLYQQ